MDTAQMDTATATVMATATQPGERVWFGFGWKRCNRDKRQVTRKSLERCSDASGVQRPE
jgi:hypothetical protein